MQTPALQQRLNSYQQWKARVARAIEELDAWLEAHRRATPRAREQLQGALASLRRDRLTVALVAELSRGKTELINAIFFSDLGGRLLPSGGWRTTTCPTELMWDSERNEAYLRLLPVETRAQDTPIAELKTDSKHWVHYPLNVQVPEQMASTLKEILETKKVSLAEATRLGLSSAALAADRQSLGDRPTAQRPADTTLHSPISWLTPVDGSAGQRTPVGQVEIPKWRHAIVSFPHPLLKQGLVILDTPGIVALGAEPELTTGMLPAAQAVLFVLAADTGVSRSDLEIWQHHLKGFQSGRKRAMLVALNKVDTLWDERGDPASADAAIAAQRRTAAQTLGIGEDSVFPVSAQKGLVGKIRKDDALLRRSGLPTLERQLAARMLETKHQLMLDAIDGSVGQVLDRNRTRIASRIERIKSQLEELEHLRDKSQDMIAQLLEKTRREQERYLRGVQQFQQSREELLVQTRPCRQILEPENIESIIERAHHDLAHSWTTVGLAQAMKGLFDELRRSMQSLATESERIRKLVRETYQIFREDFEFDLATPKVFVPMKYRVEIELLFQEVEAFRRSPTMLLASQGRVIRRFDQQMVSRAQVLFDQLRIAYDGWIRDTLLPLSDEIQEHKTTMEKRLENLQRIGRSKDALQKRIDDMQTQYVGFAQELTALRNIHNALHYDPLTDQEAPQRPRLVSG